MKLSIPAQTNAPRRWFHYLLYPRSLFTLILCLVALLTHVAFGLYVWLGH